MISKLDERLRSASAAIFGLTVLALALRAVTIRDSLQGDELFLFNIVHNHSLGQVLHIVRETEKTPPLGFILDWLTSHLGDPTLWVRLPSLMCGTALVPLSYALGTRLVNRAAGLLAAVLITLSAFGIFYGVEARAYAAVAFFSALSTLCLLKALEVDRWRWWTAYGLAVLATIYTHYVGFFVVIIQAAWALWVHRERLRTLLVVHGLIVFAYAPWIPSFLLQERHSADEARRIALFAPSSVARFGMINAQDLFGHPFAALSQIPGSAPLALAVTVTVLAAAIVLRQVWRPRMWTSLGSGPGLAVLLAFAAPVGVALVSVRPAMSFMIARNLSSSYVMAMIVIAAAVVSLRRLLAAPVIVALVGVMAIGTVKALKPAYRRSPYREVAHYIDSLSPARDPIIQQFFVPTNGPLANVTAINLSHPRFVAVDEAGAAVAWDRGHHGDEVFVVEDLPGILKPTRSLPPRDGPGGQFVRVAARKFQGLDNVLVAEYRYRPT